MIKLQKIRGNKKQKMVCSHGDSINNMAISLAYTYNFLLKFMYLAIYQYIVKN